MSQEQRMTFDPWHDILTPANLLSAAGFGMVCLGAEQMDDPSGVCWVICGRIIEALDGADE